MITKEKIEIYSIYRGDIDGWARAGTNEQKAIMNDQDWLVIGNLVQDLRLVNNGFASKSYTDDIKERLKKYCDSHACIERLKAIANTAN